MRVEVTRARARDLVTRAIAAALALVVAGCASTTVHLSPQEPEVLDERDLVVAAAEVEQSVIAAGLVWHDERLDEYLDSVAVKLLAAMHAPSLPVRVTVLRDTSVSASALANGVVHVYSGMLARLENEAQLAALLGHELAHLVSHDAMRVLRLRDTPRVAAGASNVLLPSSGAFASAMASEELDSDVLRYERTLEMEADDAALAAVIAAGYDAREVPKFFDMLLADEMAAGLPDDDETTNHPSTATRAERCRRQLETVAASRGLVGRERYESAIADVLLENARLDLLDARFADAEAAVDRHLRIRPRSAAGFLLRGDVLARRTADFGPAWTAYERAAALDPAIGRLARSQARVRGADEDR